MTDVDLRWALQGYCTLRFDGADTEVYYFVQTKLHKNECLWEISFYVVFFSCRDPGVLVMDGLCEVFEQEFAVETEAFHVY